jgi:pyruvate/2-oxoglutarate dehydrogenase complex dihydrolipoamide dehydrogenase (E3) component
VIGGGAGGLAAAVEARAHGASVVLIEKGRLGGDTLNAGSLPSKALAAAARHAHAVRSAAAFGIANDMPRINARGVFDHVRSVVDGIAPMMSPERLAALGVTYLAAEGKFVDRNLVAAGDRRVRARRVIIATGSQPKLPDIPGLAAVPFFTSSSIFDNPRKLTHVAIIGGGLSGIELAQSLRRLGSDVTVIDTATPLAEIDPELAAIALRRVTEEGTVIKAQTAVTEVQLRSLGIGVAIKTGDVEEVLDVSHIIVATGRTPDFAGLELARAGIVLEPDGKLRLTPGLRTGNRRVYAIGDAAGGPHSTHAASYHARRVVRHLLFGIRSPVDPGLVPLTAFTDPEIAEIGVGEAAARRLRGDDFRVVRLSFAESDRARAERQTYGLAKLVTDRRGRLLGAGIAGSGAAEMISLFSFAIANRMSAASFGAYVAAYPTLAEMAQGLGAEFRQTAVENPWLRRLLAANRWLR